MPLHQWLPLPGWPLQGAVRRLCLLPCGVRPNVTPLQVLERFHVSSAYMVAQRPGREVFKWLSNDAQRRVRTLVITMVLATVRSPPPCCTGYARLTCAPT